MNQKSIRGNTIPENGAVNPVVSGVVSGGMLLPDTHILKQAANIFHENSEQNFLTLDDYKLSPGGQTQIKLQNVGLGEELEMFIEGEIVLANSDAASKDVVLSPEFPYNIIANISTMFNGKVQLNNLSGYELLGVMAKRNISKTFMFNQVQAITANGVGAAPVSEPKVDKHMAYCYIERPGGDTTSTIVAGKGLTGAAKVTLKGATSGIKVKFGFYLALPFTFRKDIPLGLIPMQNNSIYANVTLRTNTLLGADESYPVSTTNATTTLVSQNIKCTPTYSFWGIPQNPNLYAFFVNNSYVLSTYPKNDFNNKGSKALRFNFPNNYWLIAAILTIRDKNKQLLDILNKTNNPHLVYNGTVTVDMTGIRTRYAREMFENGRVMGYGQLLFDGTSGVDMWTNSADTSKWLNMYMANNPTYFVDIDTTVEVPGEFDVLLEQLVPNYVRMM